MTSQVQKAASKWKYTGNIFFVNVTSRKLHGNRHQSFRLKKKGIPLIPQLPCLSPVSPLSLL